MSSTDRIQKSVHIRAPLERVWRAISDTAEFGSWFGMKIEGPFVAGKTVRGAIVPTKVDPEVAKHQKPYEGYPIGLEVEAVEPHQRLAFRWHPYAIDPKVDYTQEPTTLVEFTLEEKADGVLVTITESGFDQIPLERRAKAFAANEGGWAIQTRLLEVYVSSHAS